MDDSQIHQAIRDLYPEYAHINMTLILDLIQGDTYVYAKGNHILLQRWDNGQHVPICKRQDYNYLTLPPTLHMLLKYMRQPGWTSPLYHY